MIIRNFKRRPRLQELETGGEGVTTGSAAPSPAPAPADASAVGAPAVAPAPAPAPTMADMIERGLGLSTAPTPPAAPAVSAPAVDGGQPRDELGRFTFKNAQGQAVDKDGVPAPDQAAALAAQAAAAAAPAAEDLESMPADATPNAQARIRQLASYVKDRDTKLQERDSKIEHYEKTLVPAVEAMHEIWSTNQVQPEQFEQAMAIIGLMNRGDYAGALAALQPQLQLLSAHAGQTLQIDPLAGHADLQQLVQTLQMTPEAAAEVARARAQSSAQQQARQRQTQQDEQQRQQREQQQQSEQQVQKARSDVDAFCKRMQASDLDYSAIEAQLLPAIQDLLQDVPPTRWAAIVERQYQLIKNTVGAARRTPAPPAPAFQPLRPTGQGGGAPKPASMADAISQGLGLGV